MNKKGVELTMTTIIVAAISILVLVVLVLIFTKSAGNFWDSTSSCQGQGGECQSGTCAEGYSNYFSGNPECEKNEGEGSVCCKESDSILG